MRTFENCKVMSTFWKIKLSWLPWHWYERFTTMNKIIKQMKENRVSSYIMLHISQLASVMWLIHVLETSSFVSSALIIFKFVGIITDHVRSTREGNVFTGVCNSVQGEGGVREIRYLVFRSCPGRYRVCPVQVLSGGTSCPCPVQWGEEGYPSQVTLSPS